MTTPSYLFSSDVKRTFSTKELAEIADISEESLRNLAPKLGMTKIMIRSNYFEWDYSSYVKIKVFAANRKKAETAPKEVKVSVANLEELRKLHPLVTNYDFFKLTYFPDSEPEVFKSWED